MRHTLTIDDEVVILEHGSFQGVIDVDELTKIDISNIYGEHATISSALNRIGLLRAASQSIMDEVKLDLKIFESEYKSKLRKEAAENSNKYSIRVGNEDVQVKLSEKALETAHHNDPEWVKLKKSLIKAERNFNSLDSLYWSCQDKSSKLKSLMETVTPEEYSEGIVEGVANGIKIIKK